MRMEELFISASFDCTMEQYLIDGALQNDIDFSNLMNIDFEDDTIPKYFNEVLKDSCLNKTRKISNGASEKTCLHKFILDLLIGKNEECVRWCNKKEGEFEITNSSKLATLWGEVKKNPTMTYEKLARALRHYYKLDILINYKHKEKLKYKFSKNFLNNNNKLRNYYDYKHS